MFYYNHWWRTGKVNKKLLGKRRAFFNEILQYLSKKQILLLYGVRRAGKTTLMFQLIHYLLNDKEVSPFTILYYSFDDEKRSIREIVEEFRIKVLKKDISSEQVFFFFDEIQKLNNWQDQIKLLYDMNPGIKIVLSGSSAFFLKKGVSESLSGRFFKYEVLPLSFKEFLDFQEIRVEREREDVYSTDLKIYLKEYIKTGGFPEALDVKDEDFFLIKYFKESILQRVALIDIPEEFLVRKRENLYSIIKIVASKPGLYLEYKNIGSDLKIDQRTVETYFEFLEHSLLLRRIYNFSRNITTVYKKLKRIYLSSTAFTCALNPEIDDTMILEQFFINWLKIDFFWRNPAGKEVDFVQLREKKIVPVEIKIKKRIKKEDLRSLRVFLNTFESNRGVIITDEDETQKIKVDEKTITMIPYWRIWSLEKELLR